MNFSGQENPKPLGNRGGEENREDSVLLFLLQAKALQVDLASTLQKPVEIDAVQNTKASAINLPCW